MYFAFRGLKKRVLLNFSVHMDKTVPNEKEIRITRDSQELDSLNSSIHFYHWLGHLSQLKSHTLMHPGMVCGPGWSILLCWMNSLAPEVFLSWYPNPLSNGIYWCQSEMEKTSSSSVIMKIPAEWGPNYNPKNSHKAVKEQTPKLSMLLLLC